jgi:hypothetical protein
VKTTLLALVMNQRPFPYAISVEFEPLLKLEDE